MSRARTRAAAGLALSAAVFGAAGCGSGGSKSTTTQTFATNGRNFRGTAHPIAAVVDQLALAARAGQSATICRNLFTPKLAAKVASEASDKTCASGVRASLVAPDEDITVELVTARPTMARVVVREQSGKESVLMFLKQGTVWRIDSIAPLKQPQH